ncbi:2-octaprenylphenol hydroxylase [Methyloligella halotolerans]|uniref:2-octaprenylphenol hydroxylase n=1 Tax=Methyloligella halotolerans TaxID=1177755 RepID=A0A1E2S2J2_9HYPH|nr:FAD-dependent monooxygenase [Methyloligella halotolerans]ODA68632.1 2-octaprenylphenol hydroxylase [Methyloligella halotolerans]
MSDPSSHSAAAADSPAVFDAVVVGAGPSGLVTALALAYVARGTGAKIGLVGPAPDETAAAGDTRTAALMDSSIALLKQLGIWPGLAPVSAPLEGIRIVDSASPFFAAPDVVFRASELGLPAFGYNIPNPVLVRALYEQARQAMPVAAGSVSHIDIAEDHARLVCTDGREIMTKLVVGADGRNSVCRKAAEIPVQEWRYPQKAIATRFRHSLPHEQISTEFHRPSGPLTTVPLPDANESSLIWVVEEDEAERLVTLSRADFAAELESHLGALTGPISDVGEIRAFPVAGMTARTLTGPRTALVGEAAHILPPIGAQGLNLGFRDAGWLAERLRPVFEGSGDAGARPVLLAYGDSRQMDVMSRTIGVDLLNRSLITRFPPAQAARGAILRGLKSLPMLRRFAMRAGIAPPTPLPPLMQSQA